MLPFERFRWPHIARHAQRPELMAAGATFDHPSGLGETTTLRLYGSLVANPGNV